MSNSKSDQLALSRIYGWHVYVVSMPGYSKIGSAFRMFVRLGGLQGGNPHTLKVEALWHFKARDDARAVEFAALASPGLSRIPKREWCECAPSLAIEAVENAIVTRGCVADRLAEWADR